MKKIIFFNKSNDSSGRRYVNRAGRKRVWAGRNIRRAAPSEICLVAGTLHCDGCELPRVQVPKVLQSGFFMGRGFPLAQTQLGLGLDSA